MSTTDDQPKRLQPVKTTYRLALDGAWIQCLRCGRRSYHPSDIQHRYCGRCHVFHEDHGAPPLLPAA